jgi:N-acyl-L-homoserine lactone synthetase
MTARLTQAQCSRGVSSRVVAVVAVIVTAAIAVAGWLVSQAQARRATRRNMRVSYLLDAYRRLERASNRPLVPEIAAELEAAIGDVMLLGSPEQATLAADFARRFVAEHVADTQPLLLALRDSLRNELLLGELPPSAYVSLRISPGGDTASDEARVWRDVVKTTQRSLQPELAAVPFPLALAELALNSSPSAAVAVSAVQIERMLRELLEGSSAEGIHGLPMPQLASRALQLGLIDARLADSINGLSTMRILAAMDQDRLTEQRAAEFTSLAAAIEYLLGLALRASKPPAPA